MPIARMDHFTIVTKDTDTTVKFYGEMLGFTAGPRPAFAFPGAWLYNDGKAILHVVQKPQIPDGSGVLDHMAFWGTDLSRLPCTYREAVTMFTEEIPWLSREDKEWIMGRGVCEWLGWKL